MYIFGLLVLEFNFMKFQLKLKIAHWADEFFTDALGEMLSIISNC